MRGYPSCNPLRLENSISPSAQYDCRKYARGASGVLIFVLNIALRRHTEFKLHIATVLTIPGDNCTSEHLGPPPPNGL